MLFGDGLLLWFVCMLLGVCLFCFVCMLLGMCLFCFVCKFVCNFMYACVCCRVGYVSWAGLLLGAPLL